MKHVRSRLCATTEHDGLVFRAAKRFHWALRHCGIDFEDLVQAGRIGVVRAQKTFDPERGLKFSTYAAWWIRHYMSREAGNFARAIRIPVHTELKHRQQGTTHLLPKRVSEDAYQDRSGKASDRTVYDYLGHVTQPVAEQAVIDAELRETLDTALATLKPRERDILLGRLVHERTLESIGASHGITRERTRQIQNVALKKLQHELRKVER